MSENCVFQPGRGINGPERIPSHQLVRCNGEPVHFAVRLLGPQVLECWVCEVDELLQRHTTSHTADPDVVVVVHHPLPVLDVLTKMVHWNWAETLRFEKLLILPGLLGVVDDVQVHIRQKLLAILLNEISIVP